MRVGILTIAFVLSCVSASLAQQWLQGANESAEQAARRREALGAARLVNTLEASQPGAAERRFVGHEDLARGMPNLPPMFNLAPGQEIVAGWRLTLDVTPRGYWFAITDTTDPCEFRYISNDDRLILAAELIR